MQITASQAGDPGYTAADNVTITVYIVHPYAYTAPKKSVGTTSDTQTAYVSMATAGTVSAVKVVTQGATGLYFVQVSGAPAPPARLTRWVRSAR